jgi:serine/threonine protein phosphatase PrpC
MALDVDLGLHCERGGRTLNEDYAAVAWQPQADEARGLIAAIADGVSHAGRGAEAAQTTVRSLLADYFCAPDTWETTVTLDRLIGAQNSWLVAQNRRWRGQRESRLALSTLTALVLQGHSYTVAQVGDTRAWHLHDGLCNLLTEDHVMAHPDLRGQITRAIGLDDPVRVDYLQGELLAGDTFVLTSDGVHGVLDAARIARLATQGTAQEASLALVRAALEAGSRDNATAMVLRVRAIGPGGIEDALRQCRQLPVPVRLRVGDRLDGLQITALIGDNGVHRLLQARELATRQLVAVKTLHPARASDAQERAMLAHEAWLARRVTQRDAQGFVRIRETAAPSAFYLVFDWHSGTTLAQMLADRRGATAKRSGVADVVAAALQIGRALGRLHRQGVIHRDINPRNLHRSEDGQWRILDLGVALSGREPPELRALHAGTPSYMNPEQWLDPDAGARHACQADAQSDLFALGVTLYEWLTGMLPYGEIEPWQIARYRRDPTPPSRRRPDIPIWLDHILLKAIARDRRERFETAEELVLALERGAARPLPAPGHTPLVVRDPVAIWRIAFAVALLFDVLFVVWLLFLPR